VVALLGATDNNKPMTIESVDYHFTPRQLSFTQFDFKNGGYNGYAVRFQGNNIANPGFYLTYMANPVVGEVRKQRFAYFNMNGTRINEDRLDFSNATYAEGFGTVAIEPTTGNPVFTYHVVFPATDTLFFPTTPALNYWNYDLFSLGAGAGGFVSETGRVFQNLVSEGYGASTVAPTPVNAKGYFVWPVVFIGPSPIPGKQRMYVFQGSGGQAPFQLQASGARMPAAHQMLSFLDFDPADFQDSDNASIFDEFWVHKEMDYHALLHDWAPTTDHTLGFNSGRVYSSYAVQGANVALGGWVQHHTSALWSGMGTHDQYVTFCSNYGEGPFEHFGFSTNRRYFKEQIEAAWEGEFLARPFAANRNHFQMRANQGSGHTTIAFDNLGRLHIPMFHRLFFLDADVTYEDPDIVTNGWVTLDCNQVNLLRFDPDKPDAMNIHNIHPRGANADGVIGQTNVVQFIWDYDEDGWVDDPWRRDEYGDVVLNEDGEPAAWGSVWPSSYPMPYYNEGGANMAFSTIEFNYNQKRLVRGDNGLMVMMWTDSTEHYLHFRQPTAYPQYEEFDKVAHIMIVASLDDGDTWSEPIRINGNTHPELISDADGNYITWVYPADVAFRLPEAGFRLYFMYSTHIEYGSASQHTPANLPGANLKFVAMDFRINNPNVSIDDEVGIPPVAMLSQNYPNPFNPTTTIQFEVPRTGDVSLKVYNIRGQLVKTLVDGHMNMGPHSVVWHGEDTNNKSVASGVYFYRLETNGNTEVRKMVLMK
jgi:hypothetical protein